MSIIQQVAITITIVMPRISSMNTLAAACSTCRSWATSFTFMFVS